MIRRHLIVRGRVQGVGFRYACEQAAARAGVRGWVRNRSDGTVEAVLEGETSAVESMTGWVRQGPPAAAVTGVDVTDEDPEGLSGFTVR